MMAKLLLLACVSYVAAFMPPTAVKRSALPSNALVMETSTVSRTVPVKNFQGDDAGEESLELKVGGMYVVHKKVVSELAGKRQGTHSTLTRGEVRGGGRKPYKQKGTGNARRGSTRSPLIVGGGASHGPKPRDYSIQLNRKEKQLAYRTAIMAAMPKMVVVEDFASEFAEPKTKGMAAFLERLGLPDKPKVLMITEVEEEEGSHKNVRLSGRNIPYLRMANTNHITVFDLLWANKVVVSKSAMATLKERYA